MTISLTLDGKKIDAVTIQLADDAKLNAARKAIEDAKAVKDGQQWTFVHPGSGKAFPPSLEDATDAKPFLANDTLALASAKEDSPYNAAAYETAVKTWEKEGKELKVLREEAERKAREAIKRANPKASDTLESLMTRLKPENYNDVIAKLMGEGGEGTPLAATDGQEVARAAIANNQFPVAIARAADGRLYPTDKSVSLHPRFTNRKTSEAAIEEFLDKVPVTVPNHGDTRVRVFESEVLRDMHKSACHRLIFSSDGAATIKGVKVSSGREFEYGDSEESKSQRRSRYVYISAVRDEIKAILRVPKEYIVVDPSVERAFANVLRRHRGGNDPAKPRGELLKLLEAKGFLVPQVYVIGGRIVAQEARETDQSLNAVAKSAEAAFSQYVGADAGVASGSTTVGGGKGTKERTVDESMMQSITKTAMNDGGDSTLRHRPQEWVKSLEPRKLAVIGYADPLPIWEFFSPDLRDELVKHLDVPTLRDQFDKAVEDGKRKLSIHEPLRDQAKRFPRQGTFFTETREWGLDQEEVDRRNGKTGSEDKKQSIVSALHDKHHSQDWAKWPWTHREERPAFVARKGHVITHVSVKCTFEHGGFYEFTKGGLLENHLTMYICSEAMRGYGWHIRVEQARLDDIKTPESFYGDLVMYQALQQAAD